MIQITQRELTAQEKKQFIKSRIASIFTLIAAFALTFIIVCPLTVIIISGGLGLVITIPKFVDFIILIGCSLFALVFSFRLFWVGIKSEIFNAIPISEIKAETCEVKTSRAIQREDMEDFGLAFYVEAMDNEEQKTLYLWGQYLDALAYEAAFPNTHFSITWRSDAKDWVIDTQMYGSYFEAEKILPAFDHRTPWEELPKNGDILDVALDQIV